MAFLPLLLRNRSLLLILGVALIVRCGAAFVLDPPMISDDLDYHAIAQSLLNGDGFTLAGSPTAYRLPGYPLFLAAIYAVAGVDPLPVRLCQALLDVLSCFMVFLLGRRLLGERSARIAATVYALFPLSILYVTTRMSETVFTAFLLLFLLLLPDRPEQRGRLVWSGIVAGCAVLIRSTALILPVAAACIPELAGRSLPSRLRPLVVTAGTMALVILPWLARNEALFGRFSLTSNAGVNFWMGNHHGASGSYSFPPDSPLADIADDYERSDLGFRLGQTFWLEEPLHGLFITAKKFAHLFAVDYWILIVQRTTPEWRPPEHAVTAFRELPVAWLAAVQLPFMAVVLFALPGLALQPPGLRSQWAPLLVVCLLWIGAHLVVYGGARYRVPLHPLFILAAVQGWLHLTRRTFVLSRPRLVLVSVVALMLLAGWSVEAWILFFGGSF